MLAYAFRRVLLFIPTFFGATLVCFLLLVAAPSQPATANLDVGIRSAQVSKKALENQRKYLGIDQPLHVQYFSFVRRLVTLDLGQRWTDRRPIREVIGEALPRTLTLALLSMMLGYLVAIPVGVWSALKRHTVIDQVVTFVLFALYSLPPYWVALVLLLTFASESRPWFPAAGWTSFAPNGQLGVWAWFADVAWHLVLPLMTLTFGGIASISRYQRAALLETLRQDYIRTARAKGLSERAVVWVHAVRNSLLPTVTLLGMSIPGLISGAVTVEAIFQIPGMGSIALEALAHPDYPLAITIVAFTVLLTTLGMLLSDLLYAWLDPRIVLGASKR